MHYAIAFALMPAALLLLGCTSSAPGQEGRTSLDVPNAPEVAADPAILRVGSSGDYAPFSLRVPNREAGAGVDGGSGREEADEVETRWTGFSVDVACAYARDTERRLELVPFRWPELEGDLDARRFDMALSGITVRPDRSIAGRFGHPVALSGAVALVAADGPLRTTGDLDRADRAIAVNAGGHLERTARRLFRRARIEPLADNAAVLERLGRDDVHAVLTDSLEAPHWQARRPGLRAIGPLTRDRKAAWFPRTHLPEAMRFDAWLLEAERDGRLAALRARHGLPVTAIAEPGAALLARLDERLSLMTEVARSKWIRGVPVEDTERERRVLDAGVAAVERAAASLGMPCPSSTAIRRLYRAQIEAAKAIQRRWIAAQGEPAVPPGPREQTRARERLEQEIRPALLFLGDRIADLVVRAAASGARPDAQALAEALAGHALPAEHLRALGEALAAL